MQTKISKAYKHRSEVKLAENILRSCVHCGFCTATCPTYQLLGDELDSPRGRIYLIKQMLEGNQVTQKTQTHLDRCLTCRSCETTCPSGVQYGQLIDIGRELVEESVPRKLVDKTQRFLLRKIFPFPARLSLLLKAGRFSSALLPEKIKQKLPKKHDFPVPTIKPSKHKRKMLVLEGCVQSVVTPSTNVFAKSVFDKLKIELISVKNAGCCGALSHHMSKTDEAKHFVKKNIDAWWPYIENTAENIIVTASGCGAMVKDYGHILKDDIEYSEKAKKVSSVCKDISEIISKETLHTDKSKASKTIVAFHSPCTLQHGQQLNGIVENILSNAGFTLASVEDAHLCCGSAGTYSILQPDLSSKLLTNKLSHLQSGNPDVIATANIGCQSHLATQAKAPVKHWIELLNDVIC